MLAQGNNLRVRDQGGSRGRSRTQDQKTRTISTCWSNPGGISLIFVSHERVSGFPEKGLTSGEVQKTSREVRGTSGEVWRTSRESGMLLSSTVRELPGKSPGTSGKVWGLPEARGSLTGPDSPPPATRQICLQLFGAENIPNNKTQTNLFWGCGSGRFFGQCSGKVNFCTGTGRKAFFEFFWPDSGPPPPRYICFYSEKRQIHLYRPFFSLWHGLFRKKGGTGAGIRFYFP